MLQGKILSRRINLFIYGLREFERRVHCESNSEKIVVGKRCSWRIYAISSGGGRAVVHAEETSNNEVIVNNGNYSINGTTYTYTGYLSSVYWAGGSFNTALNANNNIFTINGGNLSPETGGIWAGHSYYGNVNGNILYLYGGNFESTRELTAGGLTYNGGATGYASNNILNIGGKIYWGTTDSTRTLYGGAGVTTTSNTVNVTDGAEIISTIDTTNNGIAIRAATFWTNDDITAYSSGNSLNITGGNIDIQEIEGSDIFNMTATVTDNSVNISNGTVNLTNNIIGGRIYTPSDDNSLVSANKVNITGGTVNSSFIYGGIVDATRCNLENSPYLL